MRGRIIRPSYDVAHPSCFLLPYSLFGLGAQNRPLRSANDRHGSEGGYQVVIVDMNGDGRPDLLALASGIPDLVWFENPKWQRHVIASGFNRMINVAAVDTDGDRIPELMLAHEFSNEAKKSEGIVSLLEYQGPKQPWKRTDIDNCRRRTACAY